MKQILVAGGAGYIGSICVEQLLNQGYAVTVFDNTSTGHRQAVDPRAQFVQGDLLDRDAIHAAVAKVKPAAIMHFAANSLVGESMTDPSKYFSNNVSGGLNLLDAAAANNVGHFVFSSTAATFGLPPDQAPIHESTPQRPINPYGESKLMFEHMLRWYDQIHGLKFVTLRYFNAAGASQKYGEDHGTETHLIPRVLKAVQGQLPDVQIYGTDYDTPDGTCIRDYIHILDLAQAHILALGVEQSASYNLGTGGGTSVREVIAACERVVGQKIPVTEKPRRPGDPSHLIASSEKIKKELGWAPTHQSIDTIVESAWLWHQAHPDGYKD